MNENSSGVGAPAGLTGDRDMREQVADSAIASPASPPIKPPTGAPPATGDVTIPEGGLPTSGPRQPQVGD